MVGDGNVSKGNALLDLGRLADIGQVQIVLSKSGPGQSKNGNTKSKRLKRECFHNFACGWAITLVRFSALRYQIITRFSLPLLRVELTSDMLPFGCLWYGEPNAINYATFFQPLRSGCDSPLRRSGKRDQDAVGRQLEDNWFPASADKYLAYRALLCSAARSLAAESDRMSNLRGVTPACDERSES